MIVLTITTYGYPILQLIDLRNAMAKAASYLMHQAKLLTQSNRFAPGGNA
jgi:hypothetical protein